MGCPPVLEGSHGPHLPPARECLFTHFLKELDLHGCNETGHTVAEFEQRQLELPVLIEAVTLSAQPLEWSYLRIIPILRRRLKEAAQVCWRSESSVLCALPVRDSPGVLREQYI